MILIPVWVVFDIRRANREGWLYTNGRRKIFKDKQPRLFRISYVWRIIFIPFWLSLGIGGLALVVFNGDKFLK